jgi:hypothetical protein
VNTLSDAPLEGLRAERHRLSEEVARLAWLRRVVVARCDLEVARLVGLVAGADELPGDVRAALSGHTPALTPATLQQLAACARTLAASVAVGQQRLDEATREVVERYTEDPARCLAAAVPEPDSVRSGPVPGSRQAQA